MRVIGIDPGLRNLGWGVIDMTGGRLSHVANGILHSEGDDLAMRLLSLFEALTVAENIEFGLDVAGRPKVVLVTSSLPEEGKTFFSVALARSVMAHDDLAAGRLVRLFPQVRLESALAYYVVYRPECIAQPKVAAFRDWLLREAHGPA